MMIDGRYQGANGSSSVTPRVTSSKAVILHTQSPRQESTRISFHAPIGLPFRQIRQVEVLIRCYRSATITGDDEITSSSPATSRIGPSLYHRWRLSKEKRQFLAWAYVFEKSDRSVLSCEELVAVSSSHDWRGFHDAVLGECIARPNRRRWRFAGQGSHHIWRTTADRRRRGRYVRKKQDVLGIINALATFQAMLIPQWQLGPCWGM